MKVTSEAQIPYKQTSGWPASPRSSDKSKHGIPQHENTLQLSSTKKQGTKEMVNLSGRHKLNLTE